MPWSASHTGILNALDLRPSDQQTFNAQRKSTKAQRPRVADKELPLLWVAAPNSELVSTRARRYDCAVKTMIICYLVSVTGDNWADRFARRIAQRRHEPNLLVDVLSAALPFVFIYVSVIMNVSPTSEWGRGHFVIAGFFCIAFCLLVIFGLGANIAINRQWSRSYPLIAIYFASIITMFAKLHVLLGVIDRGEATNDYYSALYLSLITISNLGSGEVVPSLEGRFVAVTESLIGYVALAFLAALLFTTMQRGMRKQIKAYNRRRQALLSATPPT
jgi:hypothetical protein